MIALANLYSVVSLPARGAGSEIGADEVDAVILKKSLSVQGVRIEINHAVEG